MDNQQQLRELITLFLELNPEPADAQVHSLAAALGMDKESLEAVMYEMLGEVTGSLIEADSQEILDGDVDPDNMPIDDVALNDGDPTADDLGLQEETDSDGTDVHDVGVGMNGIDDVLSDDGVPDMTEEA